MGVQHADQFSGGTDHRSGLARLHPGVEEDFQRFGSSEDRASPDILDDHTLRALQRRPTGSAPGVVDTREKVEERLIETVMRFDPEQAFGTVKQLNVPHVRAGGFDGHLHQRVEQVVGSSLMKQKPGKR